jgi:hypothetical protein
MTAVLSMMCVRVHLMSAVSPDTPSTSCIPTRRNQGVSSLADGMARHVDLHDQSNNIHSTDLSTMCALK